MAVSVDASSVIAFLALLLSLYATWRTFQFNKRQEALIDSQETLNKMMLEKGRSEALSEKKADLKAAFIKLGSSKHRLKIWNQGKAVARNVRIEFPNGGHIFMQHEIEQKFPLEVLEQYQAVELVAVVGLQTPRKHEVRLIWSDDSSEREEKTLYPTIQ